MTITTLDVRDEYTAAAGQTVFNYTFKIYASTDLNVYVTPGGDDADDSTDLVVGYSVAGVGNENGGAITLVAPTALGDKVTIVSNIPSNRTTDYQNNGDFLPDTVNDDFDRVVSLVKQVEDLASRTALLQQSQQGSKPFSLPTPEPGYYLVWNATSDGFINVASQNIVGALQALPGVEITVNDAGYDCDFRVESTTDQYAIFLDASTGNMTFNNTFQLLALSDSETVFNESGQDVDFRVESSVNANAFILDGAYCASGFGATIEDWSSAQAAVQIGGNAAITSEITPGAGNELNIFQNAYINTGGNATYQDDDEASMVRLINGIVQHFSAALGTGDNPITWVETFRSGVSEVVVNDTSQDMDFRVESNARTHAFFVEGLNSNIGFGMSTFSGTGVLAIAEGIAPSSDPVNGGYLYVDQADEALKYRDTSGVITQIAPFIFAGTDSGDIVFNESGGDYDFRIESDTRDYALFIEGSTGIVNIDNSTSYPWNTNYSVLQIGEMSSLSDQSAVPSESFNLSHNSYVDSLYADYYQTNDNAEKYVMTAGSHAFYAASSGTAGNPITFSTLLGLYLTETVFNGGQADIDFRIASDTNADAFFLDGSSGNVGIGNGNLEAWDSTFTAMQIGGHGNIISTEAVGAGSFMSIGNNAYYDGAWKYQIADEATYYVQQNGIHYFNNAITGGAPDDPITWRENLHLGLTDIVFNDGAYDIDFRIETSLDANAFNIDGGTGVISFSNVNDLLSFDATETVFNDSGADINFRIESDTNANAFFLDATGLGHIGIGNSINAALYSNRAAILMGEIFTIKQHPTNPISYIENNISGDFKYIQNGPGISKQFAASANGDANYLVNLFSAGTAGATVNTVSNRQIYSVSQENGINLYDASSSVLNTNAKFDVNRFQLRLGEASVLYGGRIFSSYPDMGLCHNAYNDSGWKYTKTGVATRYEQNGDEHYFYNAVSGSADAAITWIDLFHMTDTETVFNEGGADIDFRVESNTNANALFLEGSSSNLGINTTDFGGAGPGVGVIGIANATAPTANPTGGGILYVDSADGALKFRGAGGTTTTIAVT